MCTNSAVLMAVLLNNISDTAPISNALPIGVFIMLSTFSIIGIIGNAIAIYIFARRRDKTTSVIFILALAGTDFFTCLVIIPCTITFEMLRYNVVYDILCKLFLFLQTSNIPFSAFIMVAIAFDRYFCICHPFLHAFTVPRAKLIVVLLALLALAFGVLTSLSFGVYKYEPLEFNSYNSSETGVISFMTESIPPYMYGDSTESSVTNNTIPKRVFSSELHYSGKCDTNQVFVSEDFLGVHQKIYTASFVISFILVAVLYTLIYKSILVRRAKKAKRKKKNYYQSVAGADQPTVTQTQMTVLNGNTADTEVKQDETNTTTTTAKVPNPNKASTRRAGAARETNLYANIKTAIMLFVVTLVFIVAFLPSWLTAHGLLPFNFIIFYMYFTYNVANPIIYAFMNQTFRNDLKKMVKVCK